MSSPIDPIRRAARLRRAQKAAETSEAREAEAAGLPVPVDEARTVPPVTPQPQGAAAFAAQLLGQDGEKRGLKGGAPVLDQAKSLYSRTEWSGAKDRRARKGGRAKTEI